MILVPCGKRIASSMTPAHDGATSAPKHYGNQICLCDTHIVSLMPEAQEKASPGPASGSGAGVEGDGCSVNADGWSFRLSSFRSVLAGWIACDTLAPD